jgi:TPR repeat protein
MMGASIFMGKMKFLSLFKKTKSGDYVGLPKDQHIKIQKEQQDKFTDILYRCNLNQNDANALYELATFFEQGLVLEKNKQKAENGYWKAAILGHAGACCKLVKEYLYEYQQNKNDVLSRHIDFLLNETNISNCEHKGKIYDTSEYEQNLYTAELRELQSIWERSKLSQYLTEPTVASAYKVSQTLRKRFGW